MAPTTTVTPATTMAPTTTVTPATTAMAPATTAMAPAGLVEVVVAVVANTEDFLDPHLVPLPRIPLLLVIVIAMEDH
jgi:hypothetical protein